MIAFSAYINDPLGLVLAVYHGRKMKRYLTTDYQGTVLQAHDVNGDREQLEPSKLFNGLSRRQHIELAVGFSQFVRQYGGVTEWTTS